MVLNLLGAQFRVIIRARRQTGQKSTVGHAEPQRLGPLTTGSGTLARRPARRHPRRGPGGGEVRGGGGAAEGGGGRAVAQPQRRPVQLRPRAAQLRMQVAHHVLQAGAGRLQMARNRGGTHREAGMSVWWPIDSYRINSMLCFIAPPPEYNPPPNINSPNYAPSK